MEEPCVTLDPGIHDMRTPPLSLYSTLSLLILGACTSSTPSSPPETTDTGAEAMDTTARDTASDTAAPDTALDAEPDAPPNTQPGCVGLPRPQGGGVLALTPAFAGFLTPAQSDRLIDLVQVEGGRWYVAQQSGQVLTFTEDAGEATTALDIRERMWLGHSESGLVSVALDPQEGDAVHLYVAYSAPPGDDPPRFYGRLARFTSDDGGLTFDPESEEVILDLAQGSPSHTGNHARFGPDGFLYYAVGDGGLRRDRINGQLLSTPYAAILRIDVRQEDPERGRPYRVPADNPFVDGEAPEIWAYGLRNVWRFSFDRETGELWAGDVGEVDWEEVNRVVRGGNYGWAVKEGPACFEAEGCEDDGMIDPVWAYSHAVGRSITGGYVYRGAQLPELVGRYLFADFIDGSLRALTLRDGEEPVVELVAETGRNIASMAEGLDGELYALAYSRSEEGAILKLSPLPEVTGDDFPRRLSETGCVDPTDPRRPADGVIPYEVVAPLWSDGATKTRWLAVPDGAPVEVDAEGHLLLPVGSVVLKHFAYGERLHETRLMIRHEDGWGGYSYAWNDEQTDAELLEAGMRVELPGGTPWLYPTRGQCMTCHTDAARRTLGLERLQLAREVEGDEGPVEQLERLAAAGLFGDTLIDALPGAELPLMPRPGDVEAPIAERARAWLHANCAHCHRPGGATARGELDLRFTATLAEMGVCDKEPEHGWPYYLPDHEEMRLVIPGDPDRSILHHRIASLRQYRMPPLASHVVDEAGAALIAAWIEALEACPEP